MRAECLQGWSPAKHLNTHPNPHLPEGNSPCALSTLLGPGGDFCPQHCAEKSVQQSTPCKYLISIKSCSVSTSPLPFYFVAVFLSGSVWSVESLFGRSEWKRKSSKWNVLVELREGGSCKQQHQGETAHRKINKKLKNHWQTTTVLFLPSSETERGAQRNQISHLISFIYKGTGYSHPTEILVSAELVKHNHKNIPVSPSRAAFESNSVYSWKYSLCEWALRNAHSWEGKGKIVKSCDKGSPLSFPHISTQWIPEMEKNCEGFAVRKEQMKMPFT